MQITTERVSNKFKLNLKASRIEKFLKKESKKKTTKKQFATNASSNNELNEFPIN